MDAPYPGRDEGVAISTALSMSVSEYSMRQLPATLINAPHILDDWKNMAQTPSDASSLLKTGVLNNANNNASSGPWRGLRSPSLSAAASHSKLSYLERVLLEIVESERMYVQDLRNIIEVSAIDVPVGLFISLHCYTLDALRSSLYLILPLKSSSNQGGT